MKDFLIIALISLLVWFGSVIVQKENYQYAAMLGMCNEHLDPIIKHEWLKRRGVEQSRHRPVRAIFQE